MNRHQRIITILQNHFQPNILELIDDSAKHHGHSGAKPEGETHYSLHIEAEVFRGLNRIASHQAIYKVLQEELDNGLHALAIIASAPSQI